MASLTKKVSLLVFVLSVLCLSSCSKYSTLNFPGLTVKGNAEQMMQCIIDRDAEKLLTYFSKDIRENESEETLEEIEALFEFIDGDIVSYSYFSGGGADSTGNFEYDYYFCTPEFQKTETTTGKIYTIQLSYWYLWQEKPECEGLCKITAFPEEEGKSRNDGVTVGEYYKLPSSWQ